MPGESVRIPLPEYVQEAARESARTVIEEHVATCPIGKLETRVKVLEARFYLLVGAILGSGILGGATTATMLRAFGGV